MSQLIPVILSGGAGSRLWPVSRELSPKPFMQLQGEFNLLQQACLRGAAIPQVSDVLIVTNQALFFKTMESVQVLSISISCLLEPVGRNTAGSIAVAAAHLQELYGNDVLMLVLPADHVIQNQDAFVAAVSQAVALAQQGKLVTFGIQPHKPETGYGYIEHHGYTVKRFVEKPSFEDATHYVNSGQFLWNAGMFCFNLETFCAEMAQHAPETWQVARTSLQQTALVIDQKIPKRTLNSAYAEHMPANSIDYALMEKSQNVAVVPCDMGWNDVGSWDTVSSLLEADEQGNQLQGETFLHNVNECYIHSPHRVVGAVGVQNLIIIDTPDALLVAERSAAQDVKKLVEHLKAEQHTAHYTHITVERPWGNYTVLEESVHFKVKRLEIKPGAQLSLQMHHQRSEHWVVVSGVAQVTNGDAEFLVHANSSTFIPAGRRHRLANPGDASLCVIEVQTGAYLGEDDIVRFDDIYGRVETTCII